MSFSQVLKNSLSVEKTTPAFCEICKKFTPTNQYAKVTELPQILSINCGLSNEKEIAFLRKQMTGQSSDAVTPNGTNINETANNTPMKPCRYGINCSRVDCHFSHPDRWSPSTTNTTSTWAGTSNTQTANNTRSNTWFPLVFNMGIEKNTQELIIEVNDNAETDGANCGDVNNCEKSEDLNNKNENKNQNKNEQDVNIRAGNSSDSVSSGRSTSNGLSSRKTYKLTSVVCQINNASQKNLVALIHVNSRYHGLRMGGKDTRNAQWYIFNDFR